MKLRQIKEAQSGNSTVPEKEKDAPKPGFRLFCDHKVNDFVQGDVAYRSMHCPGSLWMCCVPNHSPFARI
ncbi:hypothetical protein POTOM_059066 [Populus tomentosa]|uniref:Uncharacterized protein n=1 Tax=Populus tomentosa TaxID=118781 RepID=A0A8X8BZL1_POPTO|nr:hypothetical protein POTOM_059066 [Populus tomentosa]